MQGEIKINSIKTAHKIIQELLTLEGAGVTELTDQLEKPTSTIHDHLVTLEELGYVIKVDGQYQVSSRFLEIGTRQRSQNPLYNVSIQELRKLADETDKHANLMIEEHGKGVILHIESGGNAPSLDIHPTFPGTRTELHSTAPGKSILAYLPPERVDQIIDTVGMPEFTKKTITDRDALTKELTDIREQGYAYDRGERVVGLRAIGAPILDLNRKVRGAIAAYGPANQTVEEKYHEEISQKVLETANVVEMNLNYSM